MIASGTYGQVYLDGNFKVKKTEITEIKKENGGYFLETNLRETVFLKKFSKHNNIISLQDIKINDNFYEIKLQDGGINLEQWIKKTSFANRIRKIPKFICQIISGLCYLYKLKIAHCDLKPANIVLQTDEEGNEIIRIIDWGSVIFNHKTQTNVLCTENFAPMEVKEYELVLGEKGEIKGEETKKEEVKKEFNLYSGVDVFSLGLIIKYMIFRDYEPKEKECKTKYYPNGGERVTVGSKKKISDILPARFYRLWKKMLKIDPNKRISIERLYQDDFFVNLRNQLTEKENPVESYNSVYYNRTLPKNSLDLELRKCMIDYIKEILSFEKRHQRSFHYIINLVDRFMVHRNKDENLVLVSAVCVSIICCLFYDDSNMAFFQYIKTYTKNLYTTKQIIETFNRIVTVLDFDLFCPGLVEFPDLEIGYEILSDPNTIEMSNKEIKRLLKNKLIEGYKCKFISPKKDTPDKSSVLKKRESDKLPLLGSSKDSFKS